MIYDAERAKLWVECGVRWSAKDLPFIMLNIQMLGHGEAPLSGFEAVVGELIVSGDQSENHLLLTSQCFALSTYWVFGLYELLRKLREGLGPAFAPLSSIFHDVEIIRMPLAKHEVKSAPKYRGVWHYPTLIYEPNTGRVGWSVFDPANEVMISLFRGDIADRFLAVKRLNHE